MQFFGQFSQRLDTKHRAAVPKPFRGVVGEAELKRGLILTRGLDGCLWLFPSVGWEAAVGEVCRSVFSSADARKFERLFVGTAVPLSVDRQGRIELPAPLRERAGINGEVVWLGVGTRIELWAAARWQQAEADAAARYEELAEATRAE